MEAQKNPLTMIIYLILGLIVIAVAIKVILWVLGVLATLVAFVVTVAIVIGVGYLAYLIIRAIVRSSQ